jgi:hypothetical protein
MDEKGPMIKKNILLKTAKIVFSILLVFVLSLILSVILNPSIKSFLSVTHRVEANTLLVEGWLPKSAMSKVYDEFKNNSYSKIITTGLDAPDYYPVVMNGSLVFYLKPFQPLIDAVDNHYLEVKVYSELGGEHKAHFNFFVNDSLFSDFYADKRKKRYGINYSGTFKDIDSVMINFDNDAMGDFGDHNLNVKEIIIDRKIVISYKNNSVYNRTARGWEKRIVNNYRTFAELARNQLIEMGIDSTKVISVSGSKSYINRTLTSALAVRKWISLSKFDIRGINIVSTGTHSRRTWITYDRILNKSRSIGIISFPDEHPFRTNFEDRINNIKEIFGIIYYWIVLIFCCK